MWNLVCQAKPPDVDPAISRGNRTWSLLQNHNRRHSKEPCIACGITIGELRTNNRHWALVDPKNPAGGVMCYYPSAWGHKPRGIPCPFPGCCRKFRNLSHCNRHSLTYMYRFHASIMSSKIQGLRIFQSSTARDVAWQLCTSGHVQAHVTTLLYLSFGHSYHTSLSSPSINILLLQYNNNVLL
jgi:hypothetical protein